MKKDIENLINEIPENQRDNILHTMMARLEREQQKRQHTNRRKLFKKIYNIQNQHR